MRKIATNRQRLRTIVAGSLGAAAALLLARLVLRILAARPDNPVFQLFFAVTSPPLPLSLLDQGQPRFGAVLELSTLALLLAVTVLALAVARAGRGSKPNHG